MCLFFQINVLQFAYQRMLFSEVPNAWNSPNKHSLV